MVILVNVCTAGYQFITDNKHIIRHKLSHYIRNIYMYEKHIFSIN